MNFLGFDRLQAYLKLFYVSRIAVVVGDGVLAACGKTDVGHKPVGKPNRILCEAAFSVRPANKLSMQ